MKRKRFLFNMSRRSNEDLKMIVASLTLGLIGGSLLLTSVQAASANNRHEHSYGETTNSNNNNQYHQSPDSSLFHLSPAAHRRQLINSIQTPAAATIEVADSSPIDSLVSQQPDIGDADRRPTDGSRQLDASVESSPSAAESQMDSAPEMNEQVGDGSDIIGDEQQSSGNLFMEHHNSQLRAMHDLFERRQLSNNNNNNNNMNININHNSNSNQQQQLQSSQELSPISIGLDPPGTPFQMPHAFSVPNLDQIGGPGGVAPHKPMGVAGADQGPLGPALPFGLSGPLPHLLGFQQPVGPPGAPFDGPQGRGDQSAGHHHAASDSEAAVIGGGGQKIWPKIFRFTDGRINLSEFEKQKKIRLSKNQHNGENNHIESAPMMFDRPLKRKSFLILHGGIFSR